MPGFWVGLCETAWLSLLLVSGSSSLHVSFCTRIVFCLVYDLGVC